MLRWLGDYMWLDEWLFKNRISITEFAKQLGVSRDTLSHVVNGHRRANPNLALKIEEATKGEVELRELLFGEGSQRPKKTKKKSGKK